MLTDYQPAIDVIVKYLKHHLPGASITGFAGQLAIEVRVGSKRLVLPLARDRLEDLDSALTSNSVPANYKNGVIRDMTLGPLVLIGKQGLAPDVEVSKLLLNENIDWNKRVRLQTSFSADAARKLYEGLKHLNSFAADLLGSTTVPEIAKEREVMGSIIEHYEQNATLNSPDITGESLSYLKAAAFVWLRSLEADMAGVTSPRVASVRSTHIFELAEEFWILQPYNRIPLPPIIGDYISQRAVASAKPGPSIDIGPALMKLDSRLEERWRGAWQALRSENLDKVSQAANSMVEVLDKVIDRVCGGKKFKDVLAERFPKQEKYVLAQRATITALKEALHGVKHETNAQHVHTAEDLMHAAEGIIRTLLR